MSEKISFNIEAAVKGLKDITSTTTATERLTEAVEAQREAMKQAKRQLNDLNGYDKAKERINKLGGQLDEAREKYERLGRELKQQNKTNAATRTEYK
ncbi:phage tail tape measure protein, partial [Salinivibrio sp. VYel6]|nr:phage tail tape measure protein [Salinivibrio sp. VYel6]